MKWCLPFSPKALNSRIRIGEKCVLMGSCFSQNMLSHGQLAGLHFIDPEFGTIFHPAVMARVIEDALTENWAAFEHRCFETEEGHFKSWDLGGEFSTDSLSSIQTLAVTKAKRLQELFLTADHLVFTFGSAWYYETKGLIVANCHKQKQDRFQKNISASSTLEVTYRKLLEVIRAKNPNVNVIVTVSPVRHKRDGLVENNRSKARLLLLCEQLETQGCHYFPAYELLIDQLRDHRFFAEDLVHPNAIAIKEVWEQFELACLTPEEQALRAAIKGVNSLKAHRPSTTDKLGEHRRAIEQKVEELSKRHPAIFWA